MKRSGVVSLEHGVSLRDFRFTVMEEDNKLRIWLEDCTTKEQCKQRGSS